MGDSSNWEFAAAIAAVSIGLSGLLLFTLIGTFGSWFVFGRTAQAAGEATKANVAMQDLARQIAMRDSMPPAVIDLTPAMSQIEALRSQTDALMKQQARMQQSMHSLAEAPKADDETAAHVKELEGAVRRLEDNLAQVAAAVANLAQRQT